MRKKYKKYLISFFLLLWLKLTFTFFLNEVIIHHYQNQNYQQNLIPFLYFINYPEPYIVYYNHGNLLFQNNQFKEAEKKYHQALKNNPPKQKVCDIRINLSLALIHQIDTNSNNKTILKQLKQAKNNLYENKCASPIDNNGISKTAEKLEEEIKKLETKLNNSTNDPSNPNNKEEESPTQKEDSKLKEKLKEQEKEASTNRQSDLDAYQNLDNYEYYSGKKW